MGIDEALWNKLNHEHCSYKEKGATPQSLCRNEYNVTGLCSRSVCPLANDKYATVLDKEGVIFLYMKTPERAHSPKHLWEKVKLSNNFLQALDQVSKHMEHWPDSQVNRVKQRLTKLRQMLVRTRNITAQQASGQGTTLVPIKRKTEKREAKLELKAETAAKLESSIGRELLNRLKAGMYGNLHKTPSLQLDTGSSSKKASHATSSVEPAAAFVEDCEDEHDEELIGVDEEEVRKLMLEEETVRDIEELKADGLPRAPAKKRRKARELQRPRVELEYPRVELEYEQEVG